MPPPSIQPSKDNHIEEIVEDQDIITTPSRGQKHHHESDNSDSHKEATPSSKNMASTTLALTMPTHDTNSKWIDICKKKGKKDPPRSTQ